MRAGAVLAGLALLASCGPVADLELRIPRPFEQRIRPTQGGDLFAFDEGATVLSHDSSGGHFKVWYATDSSDAVPLVDADSSGVPDYTEAVADRFDDVYSSYIDEMGFRPPVRDTGLGLPDDGGDDRFDVYLVDFDGVGDGVFGLDACVNNSSICTGYMALENDFAGYSYPDQDTAIKVLASHEFFHAVQAAYDAHQDTWWTEATAVWAEERYDPTQEDFEGFLFGYFDEPDRSLDVPPVGSVDSFSYGMAIWAQFMDERFDPDLIRLIWEGLVDGAAGVADPEPLGVTDRVLASEHGSSFAEAYAEFAIWNLRTGPFADPSTSYAEGADYPIVARQWQGDLPYLDDVLRVYHASIQYYQGRINGRAKVTASFKGEEPHDSLRVGVVLELGPDRDGPFWLDDLDAEWPTEVDAGGHDTAILVVVNTAIEGNSARPTICFGSPEEVHVCRFGAGSGGDEPDEPEPDEPGCGCAQSRAEGAWLVMLLPALLLGLRRRQLPRRTGP